MKGVDRSLF